MPLNADLETVNPEPESEGLSRRPAPAIPSLKTRVVDISMINSLNGRGLIFHVAEEVFVNSDQGDAS